MYPISTRDRRGQWLAIGVLILGALIRVAGALAAVEVADVQRMHEVAQVVLNGENPYARPDFYVYPPPWMFVEAGSLLLARWSGLPFSLIVRVWPILADVGIGLLIQRWLRRRGVSEARAAAWSAVYLLNPVSIIITALHGQFDAVPGLLSLLAVRWASESAERRWWASGLALGAAAAFKPFPILLFPWCAAAVGPGAVRRLRYALAAALPIACVTAPFLLGPDRLLVLQRMFLYSGVSDLGYSAVLRAIWLVRTGSYWLPGTLGPDLAHLTRWTFLVSFAALFLFAARRLAAQLDRAAVLTYLLFLTVFTGISAQYFCWPLPFAALRRDRRVLWYSAAALGALIGFYLVFWPPILIGRWNPFGSGIQGQFGPLYLIGAFAQWIAALIWMCQEMACAAIGTADSHVRLPPPRTLLLRPLLIIAIGFGPAVPEIIPMIRALLRGLS
jgi:hypothetical protein